MIHNTPRGNDGTIEIAVGRTVVRPTTRHVLILEQMQELQQRSQCANRSLAVINHLISYPRGPESEDLAVTWARPCSRRNLRMGVLLRHKMRLQALSQHQMVLPAEADAIPLHLPLSMVDPLRLQRLRQRRTILQSRPQLFDLQHRGKCLISVTLPRTVIARCRPRLGRTRRRLQRRICRDCIPVADLTSNHLRSRRTSKLYNLRNLCNLCNLYNPRPTIIAMRNRQLQLHLPVLGALERVLLLVRLQVHRRCRLQPLPDLHLPQIGRGATDNGQISMHT